MNEQEQGLATRFYEAVQKFTTNTERGAQAARFEVGISDLGYCSERVRRMLEQQVPGDTDMLKAFLGTAIGDHVEQAIEAGYPGRVLRQQSVVITLIGEQRTYEVPGHPDIILPDEGIVIDAKTSDGLSLARRMGADQQKRFQRMGYGLGAHNAGMFGEMPLEEVQVGNVWIDRSGDEPEFHVELEPFDMEVIRDAGRWLDGVVYAYLNEEEAQKEPPREVCAVTCGFFPVCREWQTDVSGLIEDPELVEAVKMYLEGLGLGRESKRLKDAAKSVLRGISGSTAEGTVRWIDVDESLVPEHSRRGYSRLDIKAVKGKS